MLDPEQTFEAPNSAVPEPSFSVGELVYITPAGHEWMCRSQKYQGGRLILAGRTAIIQDIYNWEDERGKAVLANREKNGKWTGLSSTDFKYVLLVLFPELSLDGKDGIGLPDVVPLNHPRMELASPIFKSYPKHLADLMLGTRKL